MLESHVSFIMDLMINDSVQFCCIICIFLGICVIFYINMCLVFRKSISLPIRADENLNVLARKPFFQKIHLAEQVPLSVSTSCPGGSFSGFTQVEPVVVIQPPTLAEINGLQILFGHLVRHYRTKIFSVFLTQGRCDNLLLSI